MDVLRALDDPLFEKWAIPVSLAILTSFIETSDEGSSFYNK